VLEGDGYATYGEADEAGLSPPLETPLLAGGESYEFAAIANLDAFFSRVYRRVSATAAGRPSTFLEGSAMALQGALLAHPPRPQISPGCCVCNHRTLNILLPVSAATRWDLRRFWAERGYSSILLSGALNLLALCFTAAFSLFLLVFVDWSALHAECLAPRSGGAADGEGGEPLQDAQPAAPAEHRRDNQPPHITAVSPPPHHTLRDGRVASSQ
jgi:hypothetical protein